MDFELPTSPFALPTPRLYLTGFMGSGKTTAAWHLASRLGWTWMDLDRLTAVLAGRSVAALFAEGEAAFRRAEADTLARTFDTRNVVVATGGGALVQPGAMERAKAAGTVVYLRLRPETLAARLAGDTSRPLLLGADGEPLDDEARLARIETLLAERAPIYERADVVVDADALSPYEIAEAVAGRFTA